MAESSSEQADVLMPSEGDDNDLGAAIVQLMTALPNVLSTLLGKPISRELRAQIADITKNVAPVAARVRELRSRLSAIPPPGGEASDLRTVRSTFDQLLKSLVPDIPRDTLAIDYLIEHLDQRTPLPSGSYLIETSYLKYVDAISQVARKVAFERSFAEVDGYLKSVFAYLDDVMSVGQSLVAKFPRQYAELSRPRRRFTEKQAERDIGTYAELAGQFEKGIAVLVGVIELSEGCQPDYVRIRKKRLASNMKTVQNTPYCVLTVGFDTSVRNAIAHKSLHLIPLKRTVRFYDPISEFASDLTYEQVHRKTRELSALAVAIHGLPMAIKV